MAPRKKARVPRAAKENRDPHNAVMHTPDASAPRDKAAITTALRKGARQRRSGVQPHDQHEGVLPPELLQLIGGALEAPDLAAASLVCRLWSRSLRGGVTTLTTYLLPDAASNAGKARALARAVPHLASLHAHFGARSDAPALAAFFKGVRTMERLRDLRVTAWVPYAPQKGAWPLGAFGHLELGGVTRLELDGTALCENEMLAVVTGASSARGLASLVLSPGAYPSFTQLEPFQAPAWLAPAQHGVSFTGIPKMFSAPLAALLARKLPGLAHLEMAVDAASQREFFGHVAALTRLTSLNLLSGAPVTSVALLPLSTLESLQELRLQPSLANTEALEEHALLGLTQIRRLGVRLSRRPAEPLCRDLIALTRRRAPAALVELELSRCVWSAEAGACAAALTALTRLKLERLECVKPSRPSASAGRAAMSVDLQPLGALRGMRCFELAAATGGVAGVVQGLGKLWAGWAPTLEEVSLVDLTAAELDAASTLPALCGCGALARLRLLGREPLPAGAGAVDVARLPARLQELALRHVVVAASVDAARRMTSLERLSLRQCTVAAPPDAPPPVPGRGRGRAPPPAPEPRALQLLQALPALRGVELVSVPQLRDADFEGIGRLTALTSLLVCASGIMGVTHAALQHLGGLSRLRQLRWHVGDVTDPLPDVATLKQLTALASLHLPSYLHGQFARWSAYSALPPSADVHVEMPLP
ncbi:MAG: hypothetical protein J3K34DRAFT_462043 [Monoraphidium minutum]|nr:MAG: hypothetical protein J3K34DRAFT_462043 [Monoraphidium minutum]